MAFVEGETPKQNHGLPVTMIAGQLHIYKDNSWGKYAHNSTLLARDWQWGLPVEGKLIQHLWMKT